MNFTETTPLPPLRYDLEAFEVMPGIIALYDDLGYAEATVQLPDDVIDYLLHMDGRRNVLELASHAAKAQRPFDAEKFLEMVEILEEECFLDTPRYRDRVEGVKLEYNSLTVRPAMHAGSAYPDDPEELRAFLDDCLEQGAPHAPERVPDALFIPHIDPRIGGRTYGAAYTALRESDADTFILLGVPHRISYDRFMVSHMDFDTPLGPVPNDLEFVERFREGLSFPLTEDETAHRIEHSIEFQTIFLRHLFPDRDIRIVPILAGSLHEYVESGRGNAHTDAALTELYERLAATAEELGRKVCWIASVDFCHVGRKFGDSFDARDVLDDVRTHDMRLIDAALSADAEGFLARLVDVRNAYKVCGVSPMYATLRGAGMTRGDLLHYDQWDESERGSAVSFASVALYR